MNKRCKKHESQGNLIPDDHKRRYTTHIPSPDDWAEADGTVEVMVMTLHPFDEYQMWVIRVMVRGATRSLVKDIDATSKEDSEAIYERCVKEVNGWAIVTKKMLCDMGYTIW